LHIPKIVHPLHSLLTHFTSATDDLILLYAKSLLVSCANKLFSNPTPLIEEALIFGVDPTYLKENWPCLLPRRQGYCCV
jgi:hypothetical protein